MEVVKKNILYLYVGSKILKPWSTGVCVCLRVFPCIGVVKPDFLFLCFSEKAHRHFDVNMALWLLTESSRLTWLTSLDLYV